MAITEKHQNSTRRFSKFLSLISLIALLVNLGFLNVFLSSFLVLAETTDLTEESLAPVCGNSIIEQSEQCDDGNLEDSDGCSAFCQLELSGEKVIDIGIIPSQKENTPPIIKAKWEMKAPWTGLEGKDDSPEHGSQFSPPGNWGALMNYSVCALVTEIDGTDDISSVSAEIYYPENRPVAKQGDDVDYPTGGCGALFEPDTLMKLDKTSGYSLLCQNIKDNNENLTVFNESYFSGLTRTQMYDEICGPQGELLQETAFVYCADKSLTWETVAGFYRVVITALDRAGNLSSPLENNFEYLPYTGFEVDFDNLNYGDVLLKMPKEFSGDEFFVQTDGKPTVRNVGNTRLNLHIAQDDTGLGQSDGIWNIKYRARVGKEEADWTDYYPFKLKNDPRLALDSEYTKLAETLDLFETEELDFSILINNWPDIETAYSGKMWLKASQAQWGLCQE